MYNLKSASSSLELPMFLVFPNVCEQTDTHTYTDTQYGYRTLPPTLRGKGNKKLFCSACREEIGIKKSIIECHIASAKHKKGKERLVTKDKREVDIAESLKQYDKD